jgi:hypothetical protein
MGFETRIWLLVVSSWFFAFGFWQILYFLRI